MSIQIQEIQEAYRTTNRQDQKSNSSQNIKVKTPKNRDKILKTTKEKQVTYEGKHIRTTNDFTVQTMKARRASTKVFPAINDHRC